jgi:predicted acyl esterase
MTRTPYSVRHYGEEKVQGLYTVIIKKEYLKDGYIMVVQDVRGDG